MCELIDGAIGAQSKLGEDSTFRFFVNLAYGKPSEISNDLEYTKAVRISEAKNNNLKVLVAEGNEINQIVICVTKPINSEILMKQIANVCSVNTKILIPDVA